MQLQQDTLFDNRYTLRQLIGRGGFSEVWLAHDTWTELDIAIKVYAPGQGMDTNGLQIFSKELAGVFNLNQANLLKPTHVGQWLNMPYLIMEYCPKGALNKQVGKLTEQEVWKVLHDVAAGLAYLHAKEIVHQDIKPDNILLDENGDYRITDFGISTKARTTLRRSIGAAAVSGGTTAYMAPERFSANPAPTKASDIWSLGAMVFELITGDVPFGEIGGGLQKNGADIPTIHPAKGVISAELTHVVRLMLAPNAWDRPTADTLAAWASNPLALNFAADGSKGSTPKAGTNGAQKAGVSRTTSEGAPNNPSGTTSKGNTSKGGSRETTILQPGSPSADGTTSRPTPHEPNPTVGHPKSTVVHAQPKEDKKKGGLLWFWVIIGSILAIIFVIGIIGSLNSPNNQSNTSTSHKPENTTYTIKEELPCEHTVAIAATVAVDQCIEDSSTLEVSTQSLHFDASGGQEEIIVSSNTNWNFVNNNSMISITKTAKSKLIVQCSGNSNTLTRSGSFYITTTDNTCAKQISFKQDAATPKTSTRTNTKVINIDSKILSTDYHLWKILRIELKPNKTVLYERVTPLQQVTNVYCDGNEYIEDADTGKKYYIKESGIGWEKNPLILETDAPFEYTCTYPVIPDNVCKINIYDGTQYIVKNFIIR